MLRERRKEKGDWAFVLGKALIETKLVDVALDDSYISIELVEEL